MLIHTHTPVSRVPASITGTQLLDSPVIAVLPTPVPCPISTALANNWTEQRYGVRPGLQIVGIETPLWGDLRRP